ncbi:terpenoid synthase [Heliocybe sulcata]|uniref:Terpene synthase n=1 Tax=Heliocybe sulcata TaxID=5364 RepID=A0A5C3MK10_9AGAM|nr:terpenoid synthase [Heliocybe sulcata]
MTATDLILRNLHEILPYPLLCNPLYAVVRAESSAWFESFTLYSSYHPKKRALLRAADFDLVNAYGYPVADHEALRNICDWTIAAFVVDDTTDEQNAADASLTLQEFLDGLDLHLSSTRALQSSVGVRLRKGFGPSAFRRFMSSNGRTAQALIREAQLREKGRILTLEEYIEFRRSCVGVQPCFDILEYAFKIELRQYIFGLECWMIGNLEWGCVSKRYDHSGGAVGK